MEQIVRVLMSILKGEVCQSPVEMEAFLLLSEEEQKELVKIARKHSVAQLVGDALGKDPLTKDLPVTKELFLETFRSLHRTEKLETERHAICRVLEEEKIPYIQLKGSRIRPYYPEPWMRSSGDIDILVHEEDVDRTAQLLVERLSYDRQEWNYHDIPLYSKSKVLLELHFSIKENTEPMDQTLMRVWEYSQPVSETSCEYLQSDEFFMFHLVAHMAYHFAGGGCGIRTFLDLLVLQEKFAWNEDAVCDLCRQAGIARFYENVKTLLNVWFRGADHTAVTRRMEEYILSGGTFGTWTNHVTVEQQKSGSKNDYLLHRIFMPTDQLCAKYPSLERRRWLMPLYQIRRWTGLLSADKRKRARRDLQIVQKMDDSTSSEIEQMLRDNGML